MSQSIKSDTISESTIARIAGNLLSGQLELLDGSYHSDNLRHAAEQAVRAARAIAAEVARTKAQGTEG